jgi:NADH:ubiquinone oxidoreductase subunit 2 (subunit N)
VASFFSFISLYYYIVIIRVMFLGEPDEKSRFPTPWFEYTALTVLIGAVFLIGLYPKPVFEVVEDSTSSIFVTAEDQPLVEQP